MRQNLFEGWKLLPFLKQEIILNFRLIGNFHAEHGKISYLIYPLVIWGILVIVAVAMWAFFPARLAYWAMAPAGGRRRSLWTSFLSTHYVKMIALYNYFGNLSRPLKMWLQKNQSTLELSCFSGRKLVDERKNYLSIGHRETIAWFRDEIKDCGRGLVWIDGVGGSGKSALAMNMLRDMSTMECETPLPVFVGEDWKGSLAAQVARQLRDAKWTKFPTEAMARTLGSKGLICPLVDSLSERSMNNAVGLVKEAISDGDFRHLIVTSRDPMPGDQIWQATRRITTKGLSRDHVRSFIAVYLPKADSTKLDSVEDQVAHLLAGQQMPSPLFLRFAIQQTDYGEVIELDRLSLVLKYVEALRSGKIDIGRFDMRRAATIAAIVSVQDRLRPQEFYEQQLRWALRTERNTLEFFSAEGSVEVTPGRLVYMLVDSGLLVRGRDKLQFAYDPVAEYLAALGVIEALDGKLGALRKRVKRFKNTGVGRAFRDLTSQ